MSERSRLPSLACWLLPVIAVAVFAWSQVATAQRVLHVSQIGGWSEAQVQSQAAGTDAVGPRNWLIVPDRNIASYHEILQTQQMFAQHQWRVRRIDYENAPYGRSVIGTSAYRWWLGLVAWVHHRVTGMPVTRSVEHAAFYADPILHALFAFALGALVTWRLGSVAGAVTITLLFSLYPFAALFLSGAPDSRGQLAASVTASLVTLVFAVRSAAAPAETRRSCRWFFVSGALGGLALWIFVTTGLVLVAAVSVGAILATLLLRGSAAAGQDELPGPAAWRAWAAGGAVVTLLTYVFEFAPSHLGTWEVRTVHPLYGVAWLGLGELLARTVAWVQRGERPWTARGITAIVAATVAVAALPFAIIKTVGKGFFLFDAVEYQLAKGVSEGAVNFWAWLVGKGVTFQAWATLLALAAALAAIWLLARSATDRVTRFTLWLLLVPVTAAFVLGWWALGWWALLDGALLALLLAGWPALQAAGRRAAIVVLLITCAPAAVAGLSYIAVSARGNGSDNVPLTEILQLIDRDMANWLAVRSWQHPPVVVAPPNDATALYYYAGVKDVGTLSPQNEEGLRAAMRIVAASMPEEAKELGDRRGVTHYILPSWDASVVEFARMGMGQLENTFLERLQFWLLPPWLRPIPYTIPTIAGFEGQSVTILEVVDDQEEPAAMGRIGEYFLETGQLDRAATAAQQLRRFPADLGAVVARAQIELALNDTASFARTLAQIKGRVAANGDRTLPWDRRVSLAVVLARGKLPDQARAQVKRCYADANEARIRFLTTGSLYQLLALGRLYQVDFADPKLKELAFELLPPEARERLVPHN